MAWFNYLKENGFFSPDTNPAPKKVRNGYSSTRWEVLDYLEMVAEKIAGGDATNHIDEILQVIKDVSVNPVDNYLSWYRLISILGKIPNDRISLEMLNYQPVWVNSRFDTALQTAEIAETLFPKFLTRRPEDRPKAWLIFSNLFALQIIDSPDAPKDTRTYTSAYDPYNLHEALVQKEVMAKAHEHLGQDALFFLADQLNILLRDHHQHFDILLDEQSFTFSMVPHFGELKFSLSGQEEIIKDYYDREPSWLAAYLPRFFANAGISRPELDQILEQSTFALFNDLESLMGFYSIRDLEEETEGGYAVLHTFAYILTEWLAYLAKEKPAEAIIALRRLLTENRYQLPFFTRIILHILRFNWNELKTIFVEISTNVDEKRIFSNYLLHKELYQLLSEISPELDANDINLLQNIIAQGPIGERHDRQSPKAWRHRWLQALNKNPRFEEAYKESNHTTDKDYAEDGKVQVMIGTTSPLTKEEITALSIDELLNLLSTFKDKDRFRGPSVEGLGQSLQEAIKENPQLFTSELNKLIGINYSYAYRLCWGFVDAAKARHFFEWQPVFDFILNYINTEDFIQDKLTSPDDPRTTRDLLYGQIAYLISEASRSESFEFDAAELPVASRITIQLAQKLQPSQMRESEKLPDFVMSSLNTTQGKVLRAILDCSLKTARDRSAPNSGQNWEPNLKHAFLLNLKPEIYDGYTLQGMYLSQFMFLDDQWLKQQILAHRNLSSVPWSAFMAGVAFGKPISGDYYPLMHPHYQRALEENTIDLHYNSGLLRHFTAFFFWDYDTDYRNTFVFKLLDRYPSQYAHPVIQFMNTQLNSILELEGAERKKLTHKVIQIWEHLLQLFKGAVTEDDKESLKGIMRFTTVLNKLNERTAKVIIATLAVDRTHARGDFIIKQLLRFSETPDSIKFIAQIALTIDYTTYYHVDQLKNMITMLYDGGERETANQIVNRLVILGNHQFKQLYIDHNPN